MNEVPLTGGRVTQGVSRVGETVRRPTRPNSAFVRDLLTHLCERGFNAAPRHLGADELGREVFTFLSGEVPPDLDPAIPDDALVAAARLIRDYHDVTAGSALAGPYEIVCHNDLSPCNFVFQNGVPVGVIDFDTASPGARLQDVGYAIFLWLNLGTDGPALAEQARRIRLFCDAYSIAPDVRLIDAIVGAVAVNIERLRAERRRADGVWWQEQLEWLDQHRDKLARLLLA